jgi:hypothetical protein
MPAHRSVVARQQHFRTGCLKVGQSGYTGRGPDAVVEQHSRYALLRGITAISLASEQMAGIGGKRGLANATGHEHYLFHTAEIRERLAQRSPYL